MRKFKFRAWDSLNKVMFSHEQILKMKFDVIFDEIEKNISMPLIQFLLSHQDESQSQLELMQFIGLLDKNGSEIYEGDIVKNEWNHIVIIKWMNDLYWDGGGSSHPGFWFVHHSHLDENDCDLDYHDSFNKIEVIGNIYENSNLLK